MSAACRGKASGHRSCAASFTPSAIDTLVRRGEEEAMRHWDDLMALKRRLGLSDGYKPRYLPFNNEALQPADFSSTDTLRLTENNYVLLKAVGAQEADKPSYLLDDGPSLCFQTAYYYRTMFGPVGATLGWSDKTHRVNFFINLGYEF